VFENKNLLDSEMLIWTIILKTRTSEFDILVFEECKHPKNFNFRIQIQFSEQCQWPEYESADTSLNMWPAFQSLPGLLFFLYNPPPPFSINSVRLLFPNTNFFSYCPKYRWFTLENEKNRFLQNLTTHYSPCSKTFFKAYHHYSPLPTATWSMTSFFLR
jgi:hypothetical protein